MKKKILILAGGFSREREISLRTAKAVNRKIGLLKRLFIDFLKLIFLSELVVC